MRFTYIGDKDSVSLYGFTFPKGEAVNVPDDAEMDYCKRKGAIVKVKIVDKLKGNTQFESGATLDVKPSKVELTDETAEPAQVATETVAPKTTSRKR